MTGICTKCFRREAEGFSSDPDLCFRRYAYPDREAERDCYRAAASARELLNRVQRHAQETVGAWVRTTFGEGFLRNHRERALRVLEEALELAQAEGVLDEQAGNVLDRVYSRPMGNPDQEAAGVGVTLLAWAEGTGVDLQALIAAESARIWEPEVVAKCREKQVAKHADGIGMPLESNTVSST